MRLRLSRAPRLGALPAALLVAALAGCGSSSQPDDSTPAAQTQAADQEKIRELSKKGYNLREIRAIMKGEQPEPKAGKKAGHGGR